MFFLLCLALFCAEMNSKPVECAEYEVGTDAFYECSTGEEIDLSIQDDAQTSTSQRREP